MSLWDRVVNKFRAAPIAAPKLPAYTREEAIRLIAVLAEHPGFHILVAQLGLRLKKSIAARETLYTTLADDTDAAAFKCKAIRLDEQILCYSWLQRQVNRAVREQRNADRAADQVLAAPQGQ